jgi:hypothetical protein
MANTGCSSSLRSSQFLFSSSLVPETGPSGPILTFRSAVPVLRRAFQVRDRYLILPCIARNLASGIIDDPSPDKADGSGHEVRYRHSDRIGRRSVGKRAGKRARRRQSTAALHRARGSFGRAAVCADRQLAGQSDPRDHARERKHLHHDVAANGCRGKARRRGAARRFECGAIPPIQAICTWCPDSNIRIPSNVTDVRIHPYMNNLYFRGLSNLAFQ